MNDAMNYDALPLVNLKYKLIEQGSLGKLTKTVFSDTGITGFSVFINEPSLQVRLDNNGTMYVYPGTIWDFGSGPAVNTPAMVRASLIHDMFCHLTNRRLLPWSVRRKADALFRKQVKALSPKRKWYNPVRYHYWWRWTGVTAYSQLVARWRDKEDA